MATTLIEPFMEERGKPSKKWLDWKKSFQNVLIFKDLDEASDKKKISLLKLSLGSYAVNVFENLSEIKAIYNDNKIPTIDQALDALTKRFSDVDSEWLSFHRLLNSKKRNGESLKDFLTHLKSLVGKCGIPENFEDRVVAQIFISNVDNESIQSELLTMPNKDLDQIEAKAILLEKAQQEMHIISRKESCDSDVKKINYRESRSHSRDGRKFQKNNYRYNNRSASRGRSFNCKKCGNKHEPRKCPAYGKTCLKCKKPNHFASCCFTSSDSSKSMQISSIKYLNKSVDDNYYVDLSVNDQEVCFQVDTGSDLTLLSKADSEKVLSQGAKMSSFSGTVQSYSGNEVNILGEIKATVATQSKRFENFPILITNNKSPSICGKDLNKLLKIKLISEFDCLKITRDTLEKCQKDTENVSNEVEKTISPEKENFNSCTSNFDNELQNVLKNTELNEEEVSKIIVKNKPIFQGVGTVKNYEANFIISKDAQASFQKSREVPLALEELVKAELQSLLDNNFIEQAPEDELQWCSPMVVAERKTENNTKRVRICGNYRKVNEFLENETQPIPTQKEIFSKLSKSKYFSKLDMRNGYHQVVLSNSSRKYTNFWTSQGIYRYKRLPFGTKPSPFIFARIIQRIVGNMKGVVFFFDDILIHTESVEEHFRILGEVFKILKDHGMTLNLTKCQIGLTAVEYLGYKISEAGMEITDKYKASILNMEKPANKHELQKLMGCLVRVCPFLPKFTEMTRPLRELLYDEEKQEWDQDCDEAFVNLKQSLTNSLAL